MTYSTHLIVVLDACVLYPAPLRDLLLHIAARELYQPKWTEKIEQEWTGNLLLNRPDLNVGQLQKTVDAMNRAFPDARVTKYESLIDSIDLPDADDRHVLAAAIRSQADVLVTANLKDFPKTSLDLFDVEVQHPDIFINSLLDAYPDEVLIALRSQVANLKNPVKTELEVLDILRRNGLVTSVNRLQELL